MDTTVTTLERAIADAEAHLGKGEPLLAYNALQEALARWPESARLRQLQALALARSGDVDRANQILQGLAREGAEDAETLGLLARTHKDLALDAGDPGARDAHLASGFELYERAYERARAAKAADAAGYTGINAATMATLRGDFGRAREIAGQVRALCAEAGEGDYWREATLGEASLILGDAAAARAHYAKAMALAGRRYGDVGSTRRQARILARHLPGTGLDLEAALAIPPVVVFTGHMIDRADRATPRFPESRAAGVGARLRERFAALRPVAVYGSAACGADILCLEAAREVGAETHVVLPFPPAEFHRTSVDFAGGDWGERFERALAEADSVTVTSDHAARGSTATFEYANLVLAGMGRLRAQLLDTAVRGIAVRESADPGLAGGTASNLALWTRAGIPFEEIEPAAGSAASAPRPPPPAAPNPATVARHEMRAMLFADAVGFSKLSEDQIPGYIAGFLGSVAQLSQRTAHRFEHVETAGDGLYMVFRDPTDAAHFALELSAMVNRLDRAAWNLPEGFNLRVALHCGPVHCAVDPITGSPLYTGPHTSRAARIEPITPPGQVYASSAFAAVAAASGSALAMTYVGRIPLAKGYGTLGLYHLRGTS